MNHGLSQETLEKIGNVLEEIQGVQRAVLYGSRAKGTHTPGSDIDLTLIGNTLTLRDLKRLMVLLDDLLLPYTIDLSLFHLIENQELREHIARVGITLYQRL
ncbi:nucleotidyltransferase domain-containing protein [Myxococcota bacterium]|nr:nucleotidyltransferase domain-containing protein [Myxococcota bacterium]